MLCDANFTQLEWQSTILMIYAQKSKQSYFIRKSKFISRAVPAGLSNKIIMPTSNFGPAPPLRAVSLSPRIMAHADEILRRLLDDIALEQKYDKPAVKIDPLSSGGANYTSQLYLATISSPGKDDLQLFAKVAIIGEKMRSQAPMKLYDTERYIYTKLGKVYERLQEEHNVPAEHRLVLPKFYGCNPKTYEETVVLENLVVNGFSAYDRFKSVDWEYASTAVRQLAILHALSLAYSIENPEEFAEAIKELSFSWAMNDEEEKNAFYGRVIASVMAAVKEENREKMKKFFSNLDPEGYQKFNDALRRPVLMHSDYRPSNLMHKRHPDGRLEIIIVDYQTMHGGSPVVDLLYFIITGSDKQFRAQHYHQLLDHYYTELSAALRRLGQNPDDVYSREDFDYEWKEKLPYGLNLAAFTLPIVTVEAENAPKVSDDKGIASFTLDNTSDLFSERLNGVIDDYVEWGIL